MVDEVKNVDGSQAAEGSPTPVDAEALEAEMTAKMEDILDKSDGEDSSVEEESKAGDQESPDSTEVNDTDSDKGDKEDGPILPSGHRRAALNRGYTYEEIDHFLATKPDEAIKRFEELFDNYRDENSRWSDRGRQLLGASQETSETDKVQADKLSEPLPHYDVAALVEKHGNEELLNDLIAPLNAAIDRQNATTERLDKSEKFLKDTETEALSNVIQDFLTSKDMTSFNKTYGTEIASLTQDQLGQRQELFKQADILVKGAEAHGYDVTVREALERAHDSLSSGTRDETIRQEIRKSLEKRTKTEKSTHRRTVSPDTDQPVSDEELVKRVQARQRDILSKV